ncbi:tail fiber domain-containing protein [Enterobacter sp. UPMP2061]
MANLITGNLFKLLYSDDPANNLPVGAGVYEITNLAAMPTLQLNSTQVTYETYDSTYTTVLLSNKNISPFEIIVNYVPDEASTVYLDNKQDTRELFQVILNYRQTDGTIDYAAVAGYITAGSVTGSKDEVVRKTYTFTPQDLVVSLRTIDSLEPLYEGSYGVGSNGTDVPQYQPVTPEGNSFIKVPSGQTGNPAGADMMGIGLVDGTSVAEFAMTKSGTLSLYAKNATTAWTRILTATQIQSQYVPINRTVNGKALTNNITIDKSDVGLGNVTNDAQLTIANNLSDLESVDTARANLNVYSKTTVDTKVAAVQTSADSKLAKASNLSDLTDKAVARTNLGVYSSTENDSKYLAKAANLSDLTNVSTARTNLSVYSKAESDAGYMARAKNLSDVVNVATARTNLGLGTVATRDVGTSGSTIPVLNGTNTWSGIQTFDAQIINFGQNATSSGVGIEIGSLKTAGTSYIDFHSSGTTSDYDVRISVGGGSSTTLGNMYFYAANVNIPTLALTNDLSLEHGGTGASDYDQALINLNAMKFQRSSLSASDNLNDFNGNNPGFYYCTMNVAATIANNYPVTQAGSLLVQRNGANGVAGCTQLYFPYNSNDIYVRTYYVASPASWSDWNILLQRGSYGLGIDLAAQSSTPINSLGETTPTGFYYTSNENTLGGVTSDTTYVVTNRGGRPTASASKYVQQRSWDGYFMGNNGWTWKEKAYMGAVNQGQLKIQQNGEAVRLIQSVGGACYIMAMTDDSNTIANRRWYVGNGGSDNTVVLYNSKVNNNMNLQSNGAVLIQSRSDGTGSGTVYNTVFNTNGTISGPQGTVQQVASDIRLKSDVVPAKEGALERINAIGCVEFTWDWEGRRDRGFIAQQIAGIDDLYTFTPDVEGAYLNYSMTALMSDTFGAIQELTSIKDSQASKIESLENTIESQQSQIDELKTLVQQLLNQDK